MIALLKFLFTGNWPCKHKWKIADYRTVQADSQNRWQRAILKCDNCGEMKAKDLRP